MSSVRSAPLAAPDLLDIWERGTAWHPIDRALLVLQYACPETPQQGLSELTLGQRDALLLQIRRQTFGDDIEACVNCPSCGERLEFALSCTALLADATLMTAAWKKAEIAGMQWELRAPTSRDLAAVAAADQVSAATNSLLARCATPVTERADAAAIAPELQDALIAAIAALDPQAEIQIALTCQACTHAWQSCFDIASFIWTEIGTRSRRLLQEIDVLARRYGWSEADILRMSDRRRGLHVQMALA